MNAPADAFVYHAFAMIALPVVLLVIVLLWRDRQEVKRTSARDECSERSLCQQRSRFVQFLKTPTPANNMASSSASSSSSLSALRKTKAVPTRRRSPLFTADESSTYSCFGDSLEVRPWLLTAEDSAALDSALNDG